MIETKLKADLAAEKDQNATVASSLAASQQESRRLADESASLKAKNDRLARDLQAVRELASVIKSQAGSNRPAGSPDPARLADRFFVDGLRAFYASNYADAESSFRKALQFRATTLGITTCSD